MMPLDERSHDAVRELVNIASGNAASALAQLLGQRAMISVPRLEIAPVEELTSLVGAKGEQHVVVAMQVLGDVTGSLLFVMPTARAHALSAILLGRPSAPDDEFGPEGTSCLLETANILAGAYSGALGTVLQGIVMISVPTFGITPPEDLLTRFRLTSGALALCIETAFIVGDEATECAGHMILLPSAGIVESIVSSLNGGVAWS
jgi:chemotaxis protein CheC